MPNLIYACQLRHLYLEGYGPAGIWIMDVSLLSLQSRACSTVRHVSRVTYTAPKNVFFDKDPGCRLQFPDKFILQSSPNAQGPHKYVSTTSRMYAPLLAGCSNMIQKQNHRIKTLITCNAWRVSGESPKKSSTLHTIFPPSASAKQIPSASPLELHHCQQPSTNDSGSRGPGGCLQLQAAATARRLRECLSIYRRRSESVCAWTRWKQHTQRLRQHCEAYRTRW